MFVHRIEPVLVQLGPIEIRYYGLVYFAAFIMLLILLLRKRRFFGLDKRAVYDLVLYVIIGVLVGARIFEILVYEPGYYLSNPVMVFALWRGGMSFHGGVIGGMLAAWLFCKKHKVDFFRLLDYFVPWAAFFAALGRIANFINGELYGTITDVPWCVVFPAVEGCRHPVQLYSALKRFVVAGILFFARKKATNNRGFATLLFLGLLGAGRLVIDFWRAEQRYAGLSIGQYLSIAMIAAAILGFWWLKGRASIAKQPQQ